MIFDTIAALATTMAPSGIGIIRVSGDEAIDIVNKLYLSKNKSKKLTEVPSHTLHYGYIRDPQQDVIIDEVLVSVMREPNSYTMENVVEINSHGGIMVMQKILRLLLNHGIRMAEPGEFTKRAFLNGRLDLSQAEAVMDIIQASNEMALESSVKQLRKSVSDKVKNIKNSTLELIAHIEASIDYPEYDIEELREEYLSQKIEDIKEKIEVLLESYDTGRMIKEGIKTVIIGKPNVGKSSLLNTLLGEQRAIVTDIPGTTRDVLEEYLNIHGVPIRLIDTAGIRETHDFVEKIGVERSIEMLSEAELILLMIDASVPLSEDDFQIIQRVKDKKGIVLFNKIDLEIKVSMDELEASLPSYKVIPISIKENSGIDSLENTIKTIFSLGEIRYSDDVYITNVRHKNALERAIKSVEDFKVALNEQMPVDLLAIDLKNIYDAIGVITGDTVSEDLIHQIFSQFCLGK